MRNNIKKPRILALISAVVLALVLSCATFQGQSMLSVASAADIRTPYLTSNILPYPYVGFGSTTSNSGITYRLNDDYSVTLNGTAVSQFSLLFYYNATLLLDNSFTNITLSADISGNYEANGATTPVYLQAYLNGSWTGSAMPSNNWNHTIPINSRNLTRVIFFVSQGVTLTDFTIRPMLNYGSTAYPFSPYYLLGFNEGYNSGLDFNLYDVFGGATFNAVFSMSENSNLTQQPVYTYNNLLPNYYSTPGIGFSSFYEDYILSNSNITSNNGANYKLTLDITFVKPFDYSNTAPFAIRSPYEYPVNDHSGSEQYITIMNRGGFTLQADYNQTQEFSIPFTYRGYFADVVNVDSLRIIIDNPYKYLKDFYLVRQNANDTLVYDKGYQDGYDQGYNNGSGAGYDQGLEQGKEDGYSDGYSVGFDDGTSTGYNTGYTNGYNEGENYGYSVGYDQGMQDSGGFFNLFYSAVNAPVAVLTDWFDFEIFGLNLDIFITSIISIAILIAVVRLFI